MIQLADLLIGTGGRLLGTAPPGLTFSRIIQHSGQVRPGDLFVAIRGEIHDGHSFVPQALASGATGALVTEDWAALQTQLPIPLIAVPDTVEALQRLARWWRLRRPDLRVVGVTGSVGKTTTKEAIAGVLSRCYPTLKNEGNLNTEIGLPLVLLGLRPEHQAAVLEIGGAYAFGEVALLASIARPQVGVVTNVGPSHLARMGTIEAIAATKAELIEALPADGLAVLNGDDPRVRAMAEKAACRVITYGQGEACDYRATDIESFGFAGLQCTVVTAEEGAVPFRVPLPGRHSLYTALVAAVIGRQAGIGWPEIEAGLQGSGAKHRLERKPGPAGSLLIDDTYNASPVSMRAALELLAEAPAQRRLAILGGMAELGSLEESGHADIGRVAAQVADVVVTYGALASLMAAAARAAGGNVIETQTREEAVALLRSELRDGDVALFKGSNGLAMFDIVEELTEARRS